MQAWDLQNSAKLIFYDAWHPLLPHEQASLLSHALAQLMCVREEAEKKRTKFWSRFDHPLCCAGSTKNESELGVGTDLLHRVESLSLPSLMRVSAMQILFYVASSLPKLAFLSLHVDLMLR